MAKTTIQGQANMAQAAASSSSRPPSSPLVPRLLFFSFCICSSSSRASLLCSLLHRLRWILLSNPSPPTSAALTPFRQEAPRHTPASSAAHLTSPTTCGWQRPTALLTTSCFHGLVRPLSWTGQAGSLGLRQNQPPE